MASEAGPDRARAATSRILAATDASHNRRLKVVAKVSRGSAPPIDVRTRRAYFDCQFGQLHVRTAFPATGGFDEQGTLFCLHAIDASSRAFNRLRPELAAVRSVYAPDL